MNKQPTDLPAEQSTSGLPNRGTVLCVFGDTESVDAYEAALSACGFTLMRARHGMHGYWLSVNTQPDLIVTDLIKPDDESSYLLDCLARNVKTNHIPVVAIVDQLEQRQPGTSCLRSLASCFLKGTSAESLIEEFDRLIAEKPAPQPNPPADHISRFDAFFADLGHVAPKGRWRTSSIPATSTATNSVVTNRSIDPGHRLRGVSRPNRCNSDANSNTNPRK